MSELLKEIMTEEPEETTAPDEFIVADDQTAEWCIQKIQDATNQKARWKAFYEDQYRKVEDTCDSTINFMTEHLRKYFSIVPHKQTKTQESYMLPSGKLVEKQQEPEYARNDEEVIEWLKANGGERFIKVKETLDWAALKKTLTVLNGIVADENGEIIPGITATERDNVFKVEVK